MNTPHEISLRAHPLDLRIPPVAILALTAGLNWVGARFCAALHVETGGRIIAATGLGMTGFLFCLLGIISFRIAQTTVSPKTPNAAKALVVAGIYRVSRNPMYFGFLLILLAETLWLQNLVGLLGASAFILYLNYFQIGPEERALAARFGKEYAAYTAHVRRWI